MSADTPLASLALARDGPPCNIARSLSMSPDCAAAITSDWLAKVFLLLRCPTSFEIYSTGIDRRGEDARAVPPRPKGGGAGVLARARRSQRCFCANIASGARFIAYNCNVGSWTGRPLASSFGTRREESPNSAEQCAG